MVSPVAQINNKVDRLSWDGVQHGHTKNMYAGHRVIDNAIRKSLGAPEVISGKQVALRGLEREDLKLMHKWLNDAEIMEWARSQPDNIASMESIEKEFEQDLKGENPHRRTFIIVEKKTGKSIGWATIRSWRLYSTTGDIGLVIAEKSFRGKGIGTEATKLLVGLAFDQQNMHKVELFTRPDNKAAMKVIANCGFKLEGRLRETVYFNSKYHDGLMFGLLRSEYKKRKA